MLNQNLNNHDASASKTSLIDEQEPGIVCFAAVSNNGSFRHEVAEGHLACSPRIS